MEEKMENLLTIAHVVLDDYEKVHFTSMIERLQNVQKCAGVKRVRLLFFINMPICCRLRCSGCFSSLIVVKLQKRELLQMYFRAMEKLK